MNYQNTWQNITVFLCGLLLGYLLGIFTPGSTSIPLPKLDAQATLKIIGNADAPITITEYSDFQCPLCNKFYTETFSTKIKEYIDQGKVRYIFKHFPLSFHPQAEPAALASECALEQNKFWEYHDQLFEKQNEWAEVNDNKTNFMAYAKNLGLNESQFQTCLESKKYQGAIDADTKEGRKNRISGTPSFFINDETIIGAQPTEEFTKVIDKLLSTSAAK